MLVGYARVSTDDQDTAVQREALGKAGCTVVFQDIASGADRARPELARCIESLKEGDTLVVMRLDRAARSLIHLLTIVDGLNDRGVKFRSLSDAFDTASAQGRLMLQMLGAFAEFERHLIIERSLAGVARARANGKAFGNPQMKARDPKAIALMRAAQMDAFVERTRRLSRGWIDLVSALRPHTPWPIVHGRVNARIRAKDPKSPPIPLDTLRGHVGRLVSAGDLDPSVLGRAPNPHADQSGASLAMLRALRSEHPQASLRRLGEMLSQAGHHPPRAATWSAQTIKELLGKED